MGSIREVGQVGVGEVGPLPARTRLCGGLACTPDACGTIFPTTGTYDGSKFGSDMNFLIVATLVVDPTDRVAVPLYLSNDPRLPATGSSTLEGDVFTLETGLSPGGAIYLWVQPTGLLPFTWFNVWIDDLGHFVASRLPDSLVNVTAISEDNVQPCAVRTDARGDVDVRVDMMPALGGMIYESTPGGWQPVPGARTGVHLFMWDDAIAYTRSDRGGGYFLCNLAEPVEITVTTPGFDCRQFVSIDASRMPVRDMELVCP